MQEIWKTLLYRGVVYDNYEISNYGNLRNKNTLKILSKCQQKSKTKNTTAYLYVYINLGKRGLRKRIDLHRAVAEAFLQNPNNYAFVLLKDENPNNLYVDNLYWSEHKKSLNSLEESKKKKRAKTNSEKVSQRRRKLKEMSVEYKGGKCIICGYNKCIEALEFHHLDPSEKDFGISSKGLTRSWDKIKIELDKCICVCANCHREIHNGYVLLEDYKIT